MRSHIREVISIPLLTLFGVQLYAQTGIVSGVVTDEKGRAVSAARVIISVRPTATYRVPYNSETTTGGDGSYRFTGVPVARHSLCAQKGEMDVVDGCVWAGQQRLIDVTASGVRADITLVDGHRLKIRVEDPKGVLASNREQASSQRIFVELHASGGFYIPIRAAVVDGRGRHHEFVIPYGIAVRARVWSDKYDIEDDKGNRADRGRGHNTDVNVPRGGNHGGASALSRTDPVALR